MMQSDGWGSFFWFLFFGFVLWNLIKSARIVPVRKNLVVERFGRYLKTLGPGLHFLIPFADRVTASLDIHEPSLEFPPQDCQRVEVVEFIPPGGEGRISFRGATWKARFASGSQDAAQVGSRVTTFGQDNITFIVSLEEGDQNGKPNQPT